MFTIAHSTRTFDEFVELLQANKVDLVADVRTAATPPPDYAHWATKAGCVQSTRESTGQSLERAFRLALVVHVVAACSWRLPIQLHASVAALQTDSRVRREPRRKKPGCTCGSISPPPPARGRDRGLRDRTPDRDRKEVVPHERTLETRL